MPLIRAAMTAVKETTVKYDTLDFFTKRETIKEVKINFLEKIFRIFGQIFKPKLITI